MVACDRAGGNDSIRRIRRSGNWPSSCSAVCCKQLAPLPALYSILPIFASSPPLQARCAPLTLCCTVRGGVALNGGVLSRLPVEERIAANPARAGQRWARWGWRRRWWWRRRRWWWRRRRRRICARIRIKVASRRRGGCWCNTFVRAIAHHL